MWESFISIDKKVGGNWWPSISPWCISRPRLMLVIMITAKWHSSSAVDSMYTVSASLFNGMSSFLKYSMPIHSCRRTVVLIFNQKQWGDKISLIVPFIILKVNVLSWWEFKSINYAVTLDIMSCVFTSVYKLFNLI